MKSSSTALGQRFTGFAADNFHSVASPGVFERIVFRYGLAVLSVAIALGVLQPQLLAAPTEIGRSLFDFALQLIARSL